MRTHVTFFTAVLAVGVGVGLAQTRDAEKRPAVGGDWVGTWGTYSPPKPGETPAPSKYSKEQLRLDSKVVELRDGKWQATFEGECGRPYKYTIQMTGRQVGDAVLFQGSADLGEKDGGVYDWIGRATDEEFIGFYTSRKYTGHFRLARSKELKPAPPGPVEKSAPTSAASEEIPGKPAAIGAQTRAPTAEEAKTYELDQLKGRPAGQFVTAVEKGGPADKARLQVGDVILNLDTNRFYSRDDLDDFLRASEPGAKVKATIKRAGTFEEETVTVTLGPNANTAGNGQFRWQYAGVGQLDRALAAAKKAGKPVLVGLSGAET